MILKNKRKHDLEKVGFACCITCTTYAIRLFVYFNIIPDAKLCKNIVN